MESNLPPIPEESFDGEHQSMTMPKELPRCRHKNIQFKNGELRCTCGVGYQGANIHELYKELTKESHS